MTSEKDAAKKDKMRLKNIYLTNVSHVKVANGIVKKWSYIN